MTEVYDYIRLLYARIGIPHCPQCGKEIKPQSIDQMVDAVISMPERTKIQILAPVARGRKGEYVKTFQDALKNGFIRCRVDGLTVDLSEEIPKLDKQKKHTIEVVVDRLAVKEGMERRLTGLHGDCASNGRRPRFGGCHWWRGIDL